MSPSDRWRGRVVTAPDQPDRPRTNLGPTSEVLRRMARTDLTDLFGFHACIAHNNCNQLMSIRVWKKVGQVGQVGPALQSQRFARTNLSEGRLVRLVRAPSAVKPAGGKVLPSLRLYGSFGAQSSAKSVGCTLVKPASLGEGMPVGVSYGR